MVLSFLSYNSRDNICKTRPVLKTSNIKCLVLHVDLCITSALIRSHCPYSRKSSWATGGWLGGLAHPSVEYQVTIVERTQSTCTHSVACRLWNLFLAQGEDRHTHTHTTTTTFMVQNIKPRLGIVSPHSKSPK